MKTKEEIIEQIAYCEQQMKMDLDEGDGEGAVLNKKVITMLKWVLGEK